MFPEVYVNNSVNGAWDDVACCLVPCSFQRGCLPPQGVIPPWGVPFQKGGWWVPSLVLTSSGGNRSGRYAFYWNAFLFSLQIPFDEYCEALQHLMKESKFRCHVWCYNLPLAIAFFTLFLTLCLVVIPAVEAHLELSPNQKGINLLDLSITTTKVKLLKLLY